MIDEQIKAINNALSKIGGTRSEQSDQCFLQLVEERMKLRQIKRALEERPAIAVLGEAQKGKSHVVCSLLQNDDEPFMVEAPEEKVDFRIEINPITNGTQATNIITRFTTFEMPDGTLSKRYNSEHPVLVKLLSVSELATIICDCYFNDVYRPCLPEKEQVNEFAACLEAKYADFAEDQDSPVTEDDIIEMCDYMCSNLVYNYSKLSVYTKSNYFKVLSRIIRRIPVEDLPVVFGILWNDTPYLTELYARLLRTLQTLGFAREVYTDISTVRNDRNSILATDCLYGLDGDVMENLSCRYIANKEQATYARVYLYDRYGIEHCVDRVLKCELSAISAEVVLRIDSRYVDGVVHYDMSGMPAESQTCIRKEGVSKDFLHHVDLLDFPGIRERCLCDVNNLEGWIISRGKGYYLLYKYREERRFSIPLFCVNELGSCVRDIYRHISNLVHTCVGRNSEERAHMIERTQVPPFFVVETMFNVDMQYDPNRPSASSELALYDRWYNRFGKVLWVHYLNRGCPAPNSDDQWLTNWLTPDGSRPFDNCYLLRDIRYSSLYIYNGYHPRIVGSRETELAIPQSHYDNLRRTFIESRDVQHFFSNPALAWDVVATLNNDGSQYLLERLSIVASRITEAREAQFSELVADIARRVVEITRK